MSAPHADILRVLFPDGTEERLTAIREVIQQHYADNDYSGRMARVQELADKVRSIVKN